MDRPHRPARTATVEDMIEAVVTLPDRRLLAYSAVGPADGPVVLHQHGAPGGRLEIAALEDALAARHVRVITVDRPGYGGSSAAPGRQQADWPADLAALADALGVERFAVTGYSSGGPYAVAAAALLPERVAGLGVLAGVSDFGWSDAWTGYLDSEAELMRQPDEAAATAWCAQRFGADGARFLQNSSGELTPADREAMADRGRVDAFRRSLREAFRYGVGGYAQDVLVQGRPWTFDPAAVRAPAHVVHGEADTVVPVAHARHTAERIPGATLRTWPRHGHISLLDQLPQLAAAVVAPLR